MGKLIETGCALDAMPIGNFNDTSSIHVELESSKMPVMLDATVRKVMTA